MINVRQIIIRGRGPHQTVKQIAVRMSMGSFPIFTPTDKSYQVFMECNLSLLHYLPPGLLWHGVLSKMNFPVWNVHMIFHWKGQYVVLEKEFILNYHLTWLACSSFMFCCTFFMNRASFICLFCRPTILPQEMAEVGGIPGKNRQETYFVIKVGKDTV